MSLILITCEGLLKWALFVPKGTQLTYPRVLNMTSEGTQHDHTQPNQAELKL